MNFSKKPQFNQNLQLEKATAATKLLEKRRLMHVVQEAYLQQKEEYKKQQEVFKRKENELRQKDLETQEKWIRDNKQLMDNTEKKRRADKRFLEEKKSREQKEHEIEELQQKIDDLQRDSEQIAKKVDSMKKYEEYLDRVKAVKPDEFPDKSDIISRFNTLEESNRKLRQTAFDLERRNEELQSMMKTYQKEKEDQILEETNSFNAMQHELESIQEQRKKTEEGLEKNRKDAAEKVKSLGQILLAVDNLYSKCKKERKPEEEKNEEDQSLRKAKNQLDSISDYLEDMKNIYEKALEHDKGRREGRI